MGKICIHNFQSQYDWYIQRLNKIVISKHNMAILLKFNGACLLNGMSKARVVKYCRFFVFLNKIFDKDWDKATKEDMEQIVTTINTRDYSPATKHDYKILLKRFYKWLKGNDEEYPPEVKWIKTGIKRNERKLPGEGELITPEDVTKLIETSEYPRDKAFISLIWESGCRIGEIGSMAVGNLIFDKYGTVITVSGKTGSRKIRVVASTPHLRTWLNSHPFKNEKDKPLWINFGSRNHNQAMDYHGFQVMINRLFEKAGINKRHNPHLFRHSRATYMANHLTEFQMNQYFGWIQGSDMPATYVHMSGREVDKAILEMNGLEQIKKEKEKPQIKICPRCEAINDANDTYCSKCSFILDEKEAIKLQTQQKEQENMTDLSKNILTKLLQKPEIMKIITEEIEKTK